MRLHFRTEQWLPYPVEQVFAFFADPQNLPRLMPAWQRARIESAALILPPPPPHPFPGSERIQAGSGSRMRLTIRPFPLLAHPLTLGRAHRGLPLAGRLLRCPDARPVRLLASLPQRDSRQQWHVAYGFRRVRAAPRRARHVRELGLRAPPTRRDFPLSPAPNPGTARDAVARYSLLAAKRLPASST